MFCKFTIIFIDIDSFCNFCMLLTDFVSIRFDYIVNPEAARNMASPSSSDRSCAEPCGAAGHGRRRGGEAGAPSPAQAERFGPRGRSSFHRGRCAAWCCEGWCSCREGARQRLPCVLPHGGACRLPSGDSCGVGCSSSGAIPLEVGQLGFEVVGA